MKKYYLFVCILLFAALNLPSKDNNNLPELLNLSNMSKEFYFTFIPCWEITRKYLKIYVTSDVETLVTVEVKSYGYSKEKKIKPNEITEFSLFSSIGQPYLHHIMEPPEPDTVWKGAAIHVTADDPFICYAVTHFDYNSDGFLVLPVNMLGKEYIVSSYQDDSDNSTNWKPGYTGITAPYDNTKVYFKMGGNHSSMTAGGLLPGQTSTYDLDKGDVLLIASSGTGSDLTGSRIDASKPVSVVSGNFCAAIPVGSYENFIQEMELPTNFWGNIYHVTPIINRSQNSIIRVISKEARTKIFRDGKQIGYFRYAGGLKGDGWFEMRADTGLPRPVVISGDKPIGITQYNSGENDGGKNIPFQMTLIPIEQYSEDITLHTPGIRGGIGFDFNYVNFIYEPNENDSIPDDLEFAQLIAGKFDWIRLNEMTPNPGKNFAFDASGKKYFCKTLLLPGDGVYKMRSNTPMGAYMYGFSSYESYGFPASGRLIEIPKMDTLPPIPEWEMSCCGDVSGVLKDSGDIEGRSKLSTIYMHSNKSYNYKLYHGNINPCEDSTATWRLEGLDCNEDAYALITFTDCAGNDTTIEIRYYAPNIEFSSEYHKLIDINIDSVYEKLIWLYNRSENSKPTIMNLEFKNNTSGFSIFDTSYNQITLPLVIDYLDSLPLILRFSTDDIGRFRDTIIVKDTCDNIISNCYLDAFTEGTIIDTLPPIPEWEMSCCGDVSGVLKDSGDIEGRSNLSTIYMHSNKSYNYKLYHGNINPCEDSIATWRLEGLDCNEDAYALITFVDCAGNDTTVEIRYYAPDIEFSSEYYKLLDMKIDSVYENLIWLYNRSENSKPVITNLELKNNSNGFLILDTSYNQITLPLVIEKLDSLPLILRFYTNDIGSFKDTLIVKDTCLTVLDRAYLEANTDGTGIDNISNDKNVQIIPNPASDILTINSVQQINEIKIFDILVCERDCPFSISVGRTVVNTSELNNGIYFLLIKSGNKFIFEKFVICK